MLRAGVAAAVVCGLVGGAAVAQEPPAGVVPAAAAVPGGDLAAVQGYWKPLAIRYEGKPQMGADELKKVTAVIEGSEYHLYYKEPNKEPLKLARTALNLDPTGTPKRLVFEYVAGPLKGQKRHGIYEVAGNELRLCYGPADKPAPTTFAAPEKSGYFHEVWAKQPGK